MSRNADSSRLRHLAPLILGGLVDTRGRRGAISLPLADGIGDDMYAAEVLNRIYDDEDDADEDDADDLDTNDGSGDYDDDEDDDGGDEEDEDAVSDGQEEDDTVGRLPRGPLVPPHHDDSFLVAMYNDKTFRAIGLTGSVANVQEITTIGSHFIEGFLRAAPWPSDGTIDTAKIINKFLVLFFTGTESTWMDHIKFAGRADPERLGFDKIAWYRRLVATYGWLKSCKPFSIFRAAVHAAQHSDDELANMGSAGGFVYRRLRFILWCLERVAALEVASEETATTHEAGQQQNESSTVNTEGGPVGARDRTLATGEVDLQQMMLKINWAIIAARYATMQIWIVAEAALVADGRLSFSGAFYVNGGPAWTWEEEESPPAPDAA